MLIAGAGGCGAQDTGPNQQLDGAALRVVDGDTIIANLDGREERVRYIGIDTPESVKPNAEVECFGPEASKRTSDYCQAAARFASSLAPSRAIATGGCWPTSTAS